MRTIAVFMLCIGTMVSAGAAQTSISTVASADGTPIAVECAGAGPSLVIVHGGTGDRTRWTPLFPLLESKFRVCAMDRRAHGASGDTLPYSLQKEVEDVVAVVAAQPGPVSCWVIRLAQSAPSKRRFVPRRSPDLRSMNRRSGWRIIQKYWRAWRR
jgi:pimeloyl-ACP methyl ester carboxylesterase